MFRHEVAQQFKSLAEQLVSVNSDQPKLTKSDNILTGIDNYVDSTPNLCECYTDMLDDFVSTDMKSSLMSLFDDKATEFKSIKSRDNTRLTFLFYIRGLHEDTIKILIYIFGRIVTNHIIKTP